MNRNPRAASPVSARPSLPETGATPTAPRCPAEAPEPGGAAGRETAARESLPVKARPEGGRVGPPLPSSELPSGIRRARVGGWGRVHPESRRRPRSASVFYYVSATPHPRLHSPPPAWVPLRVGARGSGPNSRLPAQVPTSGGGFRPGTPEGGGCPSESLTRPSRRQ